MGLSLVPKLGENMGLARVNKPKDRPAKVATVKEKATEQFRLTPSRHQQIATLAGLLEMSMNEALGWLLQLDHPILSKMRATVEDVNRLRKED